MKTFLRVCVIILAVAVVAASVYFFVSGLVPIAVMTLFMSAISWIMVCEQIRIEREEGRARSKFYFYFFIFFGIFNLIGAIILFASGNLTFTI